MNPILIIVFLTWLVYFASLGNSFVTLDDGPLVFQNPIVQQFSFENIFLAFSSYDPELYVPLTIFSYQIEHALFGNNPFVYHFTNLVLHMANSIFVYLITRRLSSSKFVAVFCSMLFALHPIQVEAVAWIAARKDLLSAFFALCSIFFYLQKKHHSSVISFFFALISKVSVITLPLVLILIDWTEGKKINIRNLQTKLPYIFLSTVFGVIALFGKSRELASIGWWEKGLLSAKASVFYLQKMIWPSGLSVLYPQETDVLLWNREFLIPVIIIAFLVLFPLVLALFRQKKGCMLFLFCSLWYFFLLLPSFGTFWKHGMLFFASDRYVYLSSIGLFFFISTTIHQYTSILVYGIRECIIVLGVILGFLSFDQSHVWKNGITLYEQVLAVYPGSAFAHNNLGMTHFQQGEMEKALQHIDEAIAIDADTPRPYANRALILLRFGRIEEAKISAKDGTRRVQNPAMFADDLLPFYVLANILSDDGDIIEATRTLQTAVEYGQEFVEPHYYLAELFARQGRLGEAIKELEVVLVIDPNHRDAIRHLTAIRALP